MWTLYSMQSGQQHRHARGEKQVSAVGVAVPGDAALKPSSSWLCAKDAAKQVAGAGVLIAE
jgi:hypothetical protein